MMKKSKKQAKGIEQRIAREEFLHELKNPTPKEVDTAADILAKIRKKGGMIPYTPKKNISPYDAGSDGAMGTLLNKLRQRAGIK